MIELKVRFLPLGVSSSQHDETVSLREVERE
jgi:hypothetical protein